MSNSVDDEDLEKDIGKFDEEYEAHLRELFRSCDVNESGLLGSSGVQDLCEKLQLNFSETVRFLSCFENSIENRLISFAEFRDAFILYLSKEIEQETASGAESEASPKLVRGGRRYGRRSRPDGGAPGSFDSASGGGDTGTPPTPTAAGGSADQQLLALVVVTPPDSHAGLADRAQVPTQGSIVESGSNIGLLDDDILNSDGSLPREDEDYANSERLPVENSKPVSPLSTPVGSVDSLLSAWRSFGVSPNDALTRDRLVAFFERFDVQRERRAELLTLFERISSHESGTTFQQLMEEFSNSNNFSPAVSFLASPQHISQFHIEVSSGLFSSLEPQQNGVAAVSDLFDFWTQIGLKPEIVHQILEELGYSMSNNINLSSLSTKLEDELLRMESSNNLYYAAIGTYHRQVRHLRMISEQLSGQLTKCRNDLRLANSHCLQLERDADENEEKLEKQWRTKLEQQQARMTDEISRIRQESESDRLQFEAELDRIRQISGHEGDTFRQQAVSLARQLDATTQELSQVRGQLDCERDRFLELERQKLKTERELDLLTERAKLFAENETEMERSRQQQFSDALRRAEQAEIANKELKDRVDELTIQYETVRHELSVWKRKQTPAVNATSSETDVQRMSGLKVITKVTRTETHSDQLLSGAIGEHDDVDTVLREQQDRIRAIQEKHRAELAEQKAAFDETHRSDVSLWQQRLTDARRAAEGELARLRAEYEHRLQTLTDQHRNELAELQEMHTEELEALRNETRDEYGRMLDQGHSEVSQLNAQRDADREKLHAEFRLEKTRLREAAEREKATLHRRIEAALAERWESERRELVSQYETRLRIAETKAAEEKQRLTVRLRDEFREEMELKLAEMRLSASDDRELLERVLARSPGLTPPKLSVIRDDVRIVKPPVEQQQKEFEQKELVRKHEVTVSRLKEEIDLLRIQYEHSQLEVTRLTNVANNQPRGDRIEIVKEIITNSTETQTDPTPKEPAAIEILVKEQRSSNEQLLQQVRHIVSEKNEPEQRESQQQEESVRPSPHVDNDKEEREVVNLRDELSREQAMFKLKREHQEKQINRLTQLNLRLQNFNKQLSQGSGRAGILVKNLYVENAELMEALSITEQRQKQAEQSALTWRLKSKALQRTLSSLTRVAVK